MIAAVSATPPPVVGVGTSYVKVVDDGEYPFVLFPSLLAENIFIFIFPNFAGWGISRDDLVLLGERYGNRMITFLLNSSYFQMMRTRI